MRQKLSLWITTRGIAWIRLKYEAKFVMWIITRGIVWISFKYEVKVSIWVITKGIVWTRINMRQKLCHLVTAFASTTYLTCLEMLRSHLSFNISFFQLVGLLSAKNKREKTDKQSSSLKKWIVCDELTNLGSNFSISFHRDKRSSTKEFFHWKF